MFNQFSIDEVESNFQTNIVAMKLDTIVEKKINAQLI